MGVLGIYAVYLVTARFVSRRAGVLAAIVLATAPMYSLVARQAMTDMAFVGPMAMALALGALALFDDSAAPLPRRGQRKKNGDAGFWSWPHHPLFYGTLALMVLVVIPQLVIDSTQLKVVIPWGGRDIKMYGAVAMIPYYLGFALFVLLAARTRCKAPFYLYLAAIMCGLSVLAKGLAGLGLPVIVFVAYLAFTGNWRRLKRPQLRYGIIVSLIACALVAVPWHHAMLIRHGGAFWNELFGDNHWRRMVHRAPRRSRDVRIFRARARLRPAALDRAGAGGVRLGGAADAGRRRRWRPTTRPRRGSRTSSGWARSGSWRLRAGVAVDDEVPPLRVARDSRAWRSSSVASSTS